MKTIHGLLLLVILALLGILGLLRPVEGFADRGIPGPSGPVALTPPPKQPPSRPIEIPSPPSSTYTPDYKGMALSSLESMKQACNSLATIETYLKQNESLPTQIAPTQIKVPSADQLRPINNAESPVVEQGRLMQINKPNAPQQQKPLFMRPPPKK